MTEIVVYSVLCGQGKSTEIIDYMFENKDKELFCYIAPYLSECHRIAGTKFDDKDLNKKPLVDDNRNYLYVDNKEDHLVAKKKELNFKHPNTRNRDGSKSTSLCDLMVKKQNIISTHALFTDLGSNVTDIAKDYTLLIDETVNIYELDSRRKDVEWGLENDVLYFDEDGITLRFSRANFGKSSEVGHDTAKGSRYEDLAYQCDLGQLLYIDGKVLVWQFSIDLLKSFKKVIILTYLFKGSEMYNFFKKNNVDFTYAKLKKQNVLCAKDVGHLIEVLDDDKLNFVGEYYTSLTASGVKGDEFGSNKRPMNKQSTRDALRRNLHNLFNQKWKAKANDRLWTCFEDNKTFLSNGIYGKQWLASNYKATNEYRGVTHVAFLINVFMNPYIKRATLNGGVKVTKEEDDLYAISTLIQFIFRSAVRDQKPIKLYLPSSRMRDLLNRWKDGEFDEV